MVIILEKLLWKQGVKKKNYPSLDEDLSLDILIIGGGMAGISCAYFLENRDLSVAVVDASEFFHGVTMRTTGKLTYLQGDIYSNIQKTYNDRTALSYLASQKEAISLVLSAIQEHQIECDLEKTDSYLFTNESKNISKLEQEKESYEGNSSETLPSLLEKLGSKYAFFKEDTYVFHPIKYLSKLLEVIESRNIQLYEHTRVTNISKNKDGYIVCANGHFIHAKKVVVCCHYPFFFFPTLVPFHTYLEKSFIAVTPFQKESIQGINIDSVTHSFRFHHDLNQSFLIYLSESHKLGNHLDNVLLEQEMEKKMSTLSDREILFHWSNYDIMTSDYLPLIGPIHSHDEDLLLATGFNTWGMTNGTLAGRILSDYLEHRDNIYFPLFAPYRKWSIKKAINVLIDNFHNSKQFLLSKLKRVHYFYPEQVIITTIQGEKCGIYIDSHHQKHIVRLTCPHMKCGLTFNTLEKTWDCPCHGSRFDMEGNVIKGPSNYSITLE